MRGCMIPEKIGEKDPPILCLLCGAEIGTMAELDSICPAYPDTMHAVKFDPDFLRLNRRQVVGHTK